MNALSATQYTTLKQRVHELETSNNALHSGYESLLIEFVDLHLDMPPVWSRFLIENHHRHRLPESVMNDVRCNLDHARAAA